jgi:integrase/recombinase XerD
MQSTTTTATVAQEAALLERKIVLATEGFTTKFCTLVLKDRNRMSQENALVLAEYIIALKREVNPRLSYIRYTIQFLSEMSKAIDKNKPFKDMTDIDIYHYLDSSRKPDAQDPLHKWIGTYNTKRMTLMRFFKWLYYPNVASSEERNKLSNSEKKPQCIIGIPKLRRREKSCYKPSDLWSQEDDLFFLKWVTSKRDRCYHTMSRDLSARPHEILNLRIKDVVFKTTGKVQYAEVLLNGKTGSRSIPLIQSIPYVKEWLSDHPSRNNPNSPLFIGLGRRSMGRQFTISGLQHMYTHYKNEFFPKLMRHSTIPIEDKEKIKSLLAKPFNPYIRRHSALTEKSTKLKLHTLNQHAGWTTGSAMAQKYLHYFGSESSSSLLEAYGIVTPDSVPINTLNPVTCPNCGEGNTQDSKFCNKCRMVLTYDAYSDTLESEKKKQDEVNAMSEELASLKESQQEILDLLRSPKQLLKLIESERAD